MADPLITCAQIVGPALRIAGITGRPGRIAAPDQSTEAIGILNRMLGGWNIDPLAIFETQQDRYALTPPQTTYFIGPTGDFVTDRPIKIVAANVVLSNTDPELHIPLKVIPVTSWADIRMPELPGLAWPARLYNDRAVPDSKLYLFPYPTMPMDLELYTHSPLQQFAALTDAVVCPDGYEDAMVWNLAVDVAMHYPQQAQLMAGAAERADKALAKIRAANAPVPTLGNDAAGLGGRRSGDSRWWRSGGVE